jgi:DNA repair photolyase
MIKLTKEEKQLVKDTLKIPYETLLRQVRDEDYKQKKYLIEAIEFYKRMYDDKRYVNLQDQAKDIINHLTAELEVVNGMIARADKILKR